MIRTFDDLLRAQSVNPTQVLLQQMRSSLGSPYAPQGGGIDASLLQRGMTASAAPMIGGVRSSTPGGPKLPKSSGKDAATPDYASMPDEMLRRRLAEIEGSLAGEGAPERAGFIRNLFMQRFRPDEYAQYAYKRGAMPGGDPAIRGELMNAGAEIEALLGQRQQQYAQADKLAGVQQMLVGQTRPSAQMYEGGGAPFANMTPDQSAMAPDNQLAGPRLANILFPDRYDQGFMGAQEKAALFPLTQAKAAADIDYTEQQTATSAANERKLIADEEHVRNTEDRAARQFPLQIAKAQVELAKASKDFEGSLRDEEMWVEKNAASYKHPELARPMLESARIIARYKMTDNPTPDQVKGYEAAQRMGQFHAQANAYAEELDSERGANVGLLEQANKLIESGKLDGDALDSLTKIVNRVGGKVVNGVDRMEFVNTTRQKYGLSLAEGLTYEKQGILEPAFKLAEAGIEGMDLRKALGLGIRDKETLLKTAAMLDEHMKLVNSAGSSKRGSATNPDEPSYAWPKR